MLVEHQQIRLSDYETLYDRLIPKDHFLRRFAELVDFNFVMDEVRDNYCLDNGANAEDPIRMFKYLLLKVIYKNSDGDLTERARYDMSFKYFLGLRPEDDVIDSSLLSKFRKKRLKDENLLDLLLSKSVGIAIEKGIIKSSRIMVDSTHTQSRYNYKTMLELIREQSKELRKSVYAINEGMKALFPQKVVGDDLEREIAYNKELMDVITANETLMFYPPVSEKANYLKEILDDNLENIEHSKDKDAKLGHKTADTSFYGYKTHIAMTDERIITAAVITSGEQGDGVQLKALVEKTKAAGIEVDTVIGDSAYSTQDNLDYAGDKIELVSKLMPSVTEGNRKEGRKFDYNKDAKRYVCPAGHLAVSVTKHWNKQEHRKENPRMVYYFDVEKCKHCPKREGCYNGTKSKSYSVSIISNNQTKQAIFQDTEKFKMLARTRYKIEAKNSELKNRYGYAQAYSDGLSGMQIQGATTLFVANIKRIIKLIDKNKG